MTPTASTQQRRELAIRVADGISVSLFWETVGDTLTLEVFDRGQELYFELDVPRARALDAFHHPYAYLAAAQAAGYDDLLAA